MKKMKLDLREKKFTSDEKIISAVLLYFKDKNLCYFFSSIEKLINCSKKCITIKGDGIEK